MRPGSVSGHQAKRLFLPGQLLVTWHSAPSEPTEMFLVLALNARALCVPLKTFCLAGQHSCCFSCSGEAGILLAGFGLSPGHGKECESLAEWRGSQDLSLLFQSQISEIIIKMYVGKVRGCEGGSGFYSGCISLLHALQEDTHSMNILDCGWAWSSCGV